MSTHDHQIAGPEDITRFWFTELQPKQWWVKDHALDEKIGQRFGELQTMARAGELWLWRQTATGRLAEIIVLDQFSRNMYRDTPQAFGADPMALVLAQEAVALTTDQQLPPPQRAFLYMPYMHSESLTIHAEATRLFSQPGLEGNLKAENMHRTIIERFGRYPHRNKILRRESTAEEREFLQQPGSSF